jgi:nitronate monooxygenase
VAWPATRVARLLSVEYPIVQAPMAGGATTPELVAAVSEAGALGSLGAAVLPPDEIRAAIRAVRSLTERPFAVNLFAPLAPEQGSVELAATVNRALAPYREQLGLPEPRLPAPPPDAFAAQLAVIVAERVPSSMSAISPK